MPAVLTRADALREYITGAASDGGVQTDPALSLGNYRSATEAVSLGITLVSPLTAVAVDYAGGGNPAGNGTLSAVDANHLTWQPPGAGSAGPPASFSGTADQEIVEGPTAGQYLRITGTTPFTPGTCTVQLAVLANNVFGMENLSIAQAVSGVSVYRATIVRNESVNTVGVFQRWIGTLGTTRTCNAGLGGSGSGVIVITSGTFSDWPDAGWCQVRSSGGSLKEVVYYTSRSNTQLTVPTAGRALLGSSATAGVLGDLLYSTPGIAIALEPGGVQAFGASIQTIANDLTAPAGVTWNVEVTSALGLQIGSLLVNQQQGIWIWRQSPAGIGASPFVLNKLVDSFTAF